MSTQSCQPWLLGNLAFDDSKIAKITALVLFIKLVSAKFSIRHFDKMPKNLALKAFQEL